MRELFGYLFSIQLIFSIFLSVMTAQTVIADDLDHRKIEKMVREQLSAQIIETFIDQKQPVYSIDTIFYLQEKGLDNQLVEKLIIFHMYPLTEIDIETLVRLKSHNISDNTIDILLNRYGFPDNISVDDTLILKESGFSNQFIENLLVNQ